MYRHLLLPESGFTPVGLVDLPIRQLARPEPYSGTLRCQFAEGRGQKSELIFLGNIAALGRADGVVIGGGAERTAFLLQHECERGIGSTSHDALHHGPARMTASRDRKRRVGL
jgi:hypothetical protein